MRERIKQEAYRIHGRIHSLKKKKIERSEVYKKVERAWLAYGSEKWTLLIIKSK